jgi:hypothetical protein
MHNGFEKVTEMTDPAEFYDAIVHGLWPEPPDVVPLRILGLTQRPNDQDTVKHAFRAKLKTTHPDLVPIIDGLPMFASLSTDADVAGLVWARDVLLRKIPKTVTASEVTPCELDSRNAYEPQRCKGCNDPAGRRASNYWNARWWGYCWKCARDGENARQRERRAKARANRKCETCGGAFTPKRADGRFCSGACRQSAYRERVAK